MPIYLSRQIGNVFILSNEKEFEKIIKGKDGNTVLDYKQGDYPHVIMNNEVVVDVSNLKRIYSRTAFFRNRKEAFQHFSIPLDQKVKSQVFKTYKKEHKKWDDIKSLDTLANYHASYGKKEIYLEDLCKKGKLYCYDELFIYPDKRSTRDKPIYMYTIERTYFEQYWTKQNTIAIAGCLVTCVADVYSYYNPNNKKDPEDVDRDLDNMNAASREYEAAHPGDTSGRGYVEGTSRMNIGGLVTKEYGFTYKAITDRGMFTKELNDRVKANKPTIIRLGDYDYTHFVVVVGIRYKGKDESGTPLDYIINDPGTDSTDDTVRYISIDTMRSKYWGKDITAIYLIDKE